MRNALQLFQDLQEDVARLGPTRVNNSENISGVVNATPLLVVRSDDCSFVIPTAMGTEDQPDIISYCALISASICFKTARLGKCDMVLGHFPPRCVPLTHRWVQTLIIRTYHLSFIHVA